MALTTLPPGVTRDRVPASKHRRSAWTIAAGLVMFGVLYLTAWAHGRSGLETERDAAAAAVAEAEAEAAAMRNERDALRSQVALLEARRSLARASSQLERRNFGVAQSHVTQASRRLETMRDADAVRASLDEVRFLATEDVAEQRDVVSTLAEQLDEQLDRVPGTTEHER